MLVMALAALACAHSGSRPEPPPACGDKRAALRAGGRFASETERSEGVKLRVDESRVVDDSEQWKIWTKVGKAGFWDNAWLIVRKRDCSTDWAQLLYEM